MSALTEELIAQMIGQALPCPQCRERNPIGTLHCGSCGASFPAVEEHRGLSFLHQSGLGAGQEIRFDESRHLRLLRWSVEGFRARKLSLEDYRTQVREVLEAAQRGLRTLKAPTTQALMKRVDTEIGEWILFNIEAFEIYEEACLEMLRFDGHDLWPAQEGLAQAEEALAYLAESESEANWQLDELVGQKDS